MANMEICAKITVDVLAQLVVHDLACMRTSQSVEELDYYNRIAVSGLKTFYNQLKYDLENYGRVRDE